METQILLIIVGGILLFFFMGIKIVRPTHRGLIERLGKYIKFANPGFHWIIPFIDKMYRKKKLADLKASEKSFHYR
jgi:regulator of protease activity HflC (stomatin/prohibitin superfamily)